MLTPIPAWCLILSFALTVSAQAGSNLSAALARYADLSGFQQLVDQHISAVDSLISTQTDGVTILAPSNEALQIYASKYGPLANISIANLTNILSYHILAAPLTSNNFTQPRGLTVPTLLKDQQYNNRTPGAGLVDTYGAGATGQVIFAQLNNFSTEVGTGQNVSRVELRGGLAQMINLTLLDGNWTLGLIQMVDGVLDLPTTCSSTIDTQPQLDALDYALNKTDAYDSIDATPNVTCLAPANDAFAAAGNPQSSLNVSALTDLVLSHVLPQVLYSDHIQDDMQFVSMGNTTVNVALKGSTIYFNDAKVIKANILTNNGLLHVLDKVITYSTPAVGGTPTSSSPPASSTSQSSASKLYLCNGYFLTAITIGLFRFIYSG